MQTGQLDAAHRIYQSLTGEPSDAAKAYIGLSLVADRRGQCDQAVASAEKAAELAPDNPAMLGFLGDRYFQAERFDDALRLYRQVLDHQPGSVTVLHLVGVVCNRLLRFEEATAYFLQALEIDPANAAVLVPLGFAYQRLNRFTESIDCFERALAAGEQSMLVFTGRAFSQLGAGQIEAAVASFRDAERVFLAQNAAGEFLTGGSLAGLNHDLEQLEYLQSRNLLASGYQECLDALRRVVARQRTQAANGEQTELRLGRQESEQLRPLFTETIYRARGDRLAGSALDESWNAAEVQRRYKQSAPEVIHIDDFLSPAALEQLYRYCVESTIFRMGYAAGYVGSMMAQGFAHPLLLQISEELRLRLPGIFADHRLIQGWAYKYDSRYEGIKIHADSAIVNVNFWISPNEGNLDPDSGGLIVWDKPAPESWSFRDYNANETKIRKFLRESGAGKITIPFRENRALIFNSNLFHQTDRISFREDYLQRRINITLLYGVGLRAQ